MDIGELWVRIKADVESYRNQLREAENLTAKSQQKMSVSLNQIANVSRKVFATISIAAALPMRDYLRQRGALDELREAMGKLFIGTEDAPGAFRGLANSIADLAKAINNMSPAAKGAAINMLSLTAAGSLLLAVLPKIKILIAGIVAHPIIAGIIGLGIAISGLIGWLRNRGKAHEDNAKSIEKESKATKELTRDVEELLDKGQRSTARLEAERQLLDLSFRYSAVKGARESAQATGAPDAGALLDEERELYEQMQNLQRIADGDIEISKKAWEEKMSLADKLYMEGIRLTQGEYAYRREMAKKEYIENEARIKKLGDEKDLQYQNFLNYENQIKEINKEQADALAEQDIPEIKKSSMSASFLGYNEAWKNKAIESITGSANDPAKKTAQNTADTVIVLKEIKANMKTSGGLVFAN